MSISSRGCPLEKPAPVDPMVLGRQTFNVCMQCHQDTGKGIPGTYPPLVGSPIVLGDPATPVRILLHGLQGDITVEGATYNGQMPSWDRFSDEQIAAVLTYVRQAWTNTAPPVDPALVTAIRKQTGERTQPWTWPELASCRQNAASCRWQRRLSPNQPSHEHGFDHICARLLRNEFRLSS